MSFHDHEPEEYNRRFGVKQRQEKENKRKFVANAMIESHKVKNELPNGINWFPLKKLLSYSDRYEISIQFWPDMTAVYISKDGVDLQDYGGSFSFAVEKAIEYLNRITSQQNTF